MKKLVGNYWIRNFLVLLLINGYGLFMLFSAQTHPSPVAVLAFSAFYCYIFLWVFFHNVCLFEKLLVKKKYLFYFLSLIPFGIIWVLLSDKLIPLAGYHYPGRLKILAFCIDTSLGVSFYLAAKYVRGQQKYYQLAILKRDLELQQLRTQVNPHFLFNALNNIYSYTLHNDKFGNELILKLSELMRFILDNTEKNTITLSEEIRFIDNYISFEKERLGERCIIKYDNRIKNIDRNIAPLILFPFIENAFKYGANTVEKTSIELLITDTVEAFRMIIKNSVVNQEMPSAGKGLPNATRRLELIYPDKHALSIREEKHLFIVELNLYYERDQSCNY